MRHDSKPPNGPDETAELGLDARLRDALAPPPGAAERIARRALAGGPESRRSPRLRRAIAAAGLALAALALAALLFVPRLGPGGEHGPGGEPTARYSITNRGEVLVVQALDGGPSSLHSTAGERPSPPGMKIIVLGGERP